MYICTYLHNTIDRLHILPTPYAQWSAVAVYRRNLYGLLYINTSVRISVGNNLPVAYGGTYVHMYSVHTYAMPPALITMCFVLSSVLGRWMESFRHRDKSGFRFRQSRWAPPASHI